MKRRPPLEVPLSEGRASDVRDPDDPPLHGGPPVEPWGWRLLRGCCALVAVTAGLVATALGIWLWSLYRPAGVVDPSVPPTVLAAELADVRDALDAYRSAWVVFALASVAWLGVALVTSPSARRILATGALVALAGGALMAWTAPQLAWDEVSGNRTGDIQGLHLDGDVEHYVVDGREIEASTHQYLVVGHLVGACLVVTGLVAGGTLAGAQRRRSDPRTRTARP